MIDGWSKKGTSKFKLREYSALPAWQEHSSSPFLNFPTSVKKIAR